MTREICISFYTLREWRQHLCRERAWWFYFEPLPLRSFYLRVLGVGVRVEASPAATRH